MIYAIIDGQGKCINRIIWDGSGGWMPPEGCTAVPDEEGLYQIEQPEGQIPAQPDILSTLTEEQKLALIQLLQSQQ